MNKPPLKISVVPVQPHSLVIGLDNIARAFRVRRETAKRWYMEGAPIKVVNGVYRTETLALWNWLPDESNTRHAPKE